jgi:GxxExxY protein
MTDLIYKEQSYKIIGVCMNIHRILGMGLKEVNYKDAMQIDFLEQGIPFERKKKFVVKYKDYLLPNPYIADYVVFDSMIIEVKSVPCMVEEHKAQTLSYLAVSGLRLGLLINFGERSLNWYRLIL